MTQDVRAEAADTAILAAMSRLLMHLKLDDMTVAQVLTEAEISRATFYFYFASIDQVFVALLSEVLTKAIAQFRGLIGDVELRRTPRLGPAVARWLSATGLERVVVKNAVAEWPRRQDVAELYLGAVGQLVDSLSEAIAEDRRAGIALPGIPSDQLAAGWVWTAEQAWYQVLESPEAAGVLAALGSLLVATVYGR